MSAIHIAIATIKPRGLLTLAALATFSGTAHAAAQTMPDRLSVADMFMQADWVVKLVMLGLIFASIVTWTVFVAKHRELSALGRRESTRLAALSGLRGIGDADGDTNLSTNPLVIAAREEIALSADALGDRDGVKERVLSRLERHEAHCARRMTRGINILATIGATAPFVGLFGTVWGIMNAFVGIAEKQTTNLAVVAPGIAEALLATAMGLIAAIPAVMIYNHFSRMVAANRARIADSSAVVMQIVSRDLSRGTAG
ncbi:tonB-system energizer ExbB [Croceicoccus bisphenolivorans]|uniref:tonB-system energizer ExbB n=1 Tax=Croceicoccus bisphenolivorans TaxID=1783232 RepID=UPI000ABCC149|nr:tonB-system energizer ExbB [Croceicoccus bisphenolivorans]